MNPISDAANVQKNTCVEPRRRKGSRFSAAPAVSVEPNTTGNPPPLGRDELHKRLQSCGVIDRVRRELERRLNESEHARVQEIEKEAARIYSLKYPDSQPAPDSRDAFDYVRSQLKAGHLPGRFMEETRRALRQDGFLENTLQAEIARIRKEYCDEWLKEKNCEKSCEQRSTLQSSSRAQLNNPEVLSAQRDGGPRKLLEPSSTCNNDEIPCKSLVDKMSTTASKKQPSGPSIDDFLSGLGMPKRASSKEVVHAKKNSLRLQSEVQKKPRKLEPVVIKKSGTTKGFAHSPDAKSVNRQNARPCVLQEVPDSSLGKTEKLPVALDAGRTSSEIFQADTGQVSTETSKARRTARDASTGLRTEAKQSQRNPSGSDRAENDEIYDSSPHEFNQAVAEIPVGSNEKQPGQEEDVRSKDDRRDCSSAASPTTGRSPDNQEEHGRKSSTRWGTSIKEVDPIGQENPEARNNACTLQTAILPLEKTDCVLPSDGNRDTAINKSVEECKNPKGAFIEDKRHSSHQSSDCYHKEIDLESEGDVESVEIESDLMKQKTEPRQRRLRRKADLSEQETDGDVREELTRTRTVASPSRDTRSGSFKETTEGHEDDEKTLASAQCSEDKNASRSGVGELARDESLWNRVREALRTVQRMPEALEFLHPVDPTRPGCESYYEEIEEPMDLSTICWKLGESGSSSCQYKSYEDVLRDLNLVWSNCYKFNPSGDLICELASKCKTQFDVMMETHVARRGVSAEPRKSCRSTKGIGRWRAMEDCEQSSRKSKRRREDMVELDDRGVPNSAAEARRVSQNRMEADDTIKNASERDPPESSKEKPGVSLVGRTLHVFTGLDFAGMNSEVVRWYTCEVRSYNNTDDTYELYWIQPGVLTAKSSLSAGSDYAVYRVSK